MKVRDYFSLVAGIVFHPVEAFKRMKKSRKKIRLIVPIALLFLTCISYVLSVTFFHFPLSQFDLRDTNLLIEFAKIAIILVSWAICGYIMSSINDGEMTFKEFFTATAFSALPIALLTPLLAILSYLLGANESGVFNGSLGVVIAWCAVLMIVSLGILNDYSFSKTMKVLAISIFSIVVVWFISFVVYAMARQMIGFIYSVFRELVMQIQYGG